MKNMVGPPEGGGRRDPESFGNAKQNKAMPSDRVPRAYDPCSIPASQPASNDHVGGGMDSDNDND